MTLLLKDEVGMAGLKSTQTTIVGIITSTIRLLFSIITMYLLMFDASAIL
jgi:hypothetical protein